MLFDARLMTAAVSVASLEARALQSRGESHASILAAVGGALAARDCGGFLVDVGCGTGSLWRAVRDRFSRYVGVDGIRHAGLPADLEFHQVDLDCEPIPVASGSADVAAAVETIEHLENPRALVRALARIVRPGGWVVVTTPNQLSLLSLLTLVTRGQFAAFQDGDYPAHRTALVEIDLRRIATECGLVDIEVKYTAYGRIPFTGWHSPAWLARMFPRALSDNVVLIGRRPA